jgi:hypothetical protein
VSYQVMFTGRHKASKAFSFHMTRSNKVFLGEHQVHFGAEIYCF